MAVGSAIGRHPALFLLSLAVALLAANLHAAVNAASIQVGLHASWPHTSTAAEAVVWIAQNVGNHAVLPFLKDLATEFGAPSGDEGDSPVDSHKREHDVVRSALESQQYTKFVSSTLNWVLHARQFSSFVHMHYSIANETMLAFQAARNGIEHGNSGGFMVNVDPIAKSARLLQKPEHLDECANCPEIRSSGTPDYFFVAMNLPREISLSESCPMDKTTPILFFYGNLWSPQLASWIKVLESVALDCTHRAIVRFWSPSDFQEKARDEGPGLQGFTVQATLKSTEYKVVDDRIFSTRLFEDCPYGQNNCSTPESLAADKFAWSDQASDGEKPPTYTGLKVLSYLHDSAQGSFEKATQVLRMFTEDTPSVARSLHFREHAGFGKDEAKRITKSVQKFRGAVGAYDFLFVNGRLFDIDEVTQSTEKLFHCLSTVAVSSMSLGKAAQEAGISTDHSEDFLLPSDATTRLRVDLRFSSSLPLSLVWFNDLLKDSRYKKWKPLELSNETHVASFAAAVEKAKQANELPRQFAKVRAHHLSLVVLLDPGDLQQFMYTSIPETVIRSELPIRVGMVLVPNGRVSSLVAAAFHYFLREKGRRTCANFLQMIRQVLEYFGGGYQQVALSEQIVELAFQQVAAGVDGKYASAGDILEKDEDIKLILSEARAFAEEKQLLSEHGQDTADGDEVEKFSMLGVLNGVVLQDISADILQVSLSEQARVARFLRTGGQSFEEPPISEFHRWVTADSTLIVVEGLSKDMRSGDQRLSRFKSAGDLKRLSPQSLFEVHAEMEAVSYVNAEQILQSKGSVGVTVWLAGGDRQSADFKTAEGYINQLAQSEFAVRAKSRYGVLEQSSKLHAIVLHSANGENLDEVAFSVNGRIVSFSSVRSVEELKVEIASEYNGNELSVPANLRLLQLMFGEEVSSSCATVNDNGASARKPVKYGEVLEALQSNNMSSLTFETKPQHGSEALSIIAIVNPLRRNAYVISSILRSLMDAYGAGTLSAKLVLSTSAEELRQHIESPSTYSTFVLGSDPSFDARTGLRISPRAILTRLPQGNVVTVAVEPPRAWFVSSYATNYDMDNVILKTLSDSNSILNAEYELKNLIVEGSCIDEAESPPQGLKLILENEAGLFVDTLVMANLGYFQLKVPTPGRWSLSLAPGPSSTIFSLRAMEMYSGSIRTVYKSDERGRVPILVESLSGAGGILLRVERNPGMEAMSVLNPNSTAETPSKSSVKEKLKATFSRFYKTKKADHKEDGDVQATGHTAETIHVFSVATGHLYERFLKIMMSSATKHASRPIKFWLLENYLSPSFKKMLPHFARKLGCEVGMVTYRWPGWLRAQTEKQRLIWAYKILFLDVLFPLDVGRIVFVDSDQVLRGDLAELMDIDLNGAPYGYVPFCDSRKEVEGYRFWKQGFWKETLKGQKYRISALYVVDLNRFRETAAGDTLRFIYQSLSADPNSLSNLDQDLPNYASASSMGRGQSVPIFDLPADWLWCESWCDDESKKTAKAIDLCNNPMTKEPKLQSAKRIISEWVAYDDAASDLTEQIYQDITNAGPIQAAVRDDSTCSSEERCTATQDGRNSVKVEL